MKNCPKCHGRKIIANYIAIDGGICYECNGKGFVSDDHKLWAPKKIYSTPQWVKDKENQTMKNEHEKRLKVRDRIKMVLNVRIADVIDDVFSNFNMCVHTLDSLLSMSDSEFSKEVFAAYSDLNI